MLAATLEYELAHDIAHDPGGTTREAECNAASDQVFNDTGDGWTPALPNNLEDGRRVIEQDAERPNARFAFVGKNIEGLGHAFDEHVAQTDALNAERP